MAGVLEVKKAQSKRDKYLTSLDYEASFPSLCLGPNVWSLTEAFIVSISVPIFQTSLRKVS